MRVPRLTLCFKLIGSVAGLLAMLVALSLCALQGVHSLSSSLDNAVNSTIKKMEIAAAIDAGTHEMRVHAAQAEISLLNNMIQYVPGRPGEAAACSACHTAERVDANREAFVAMAGKLEKSAIAMRPLVRS